MVTHPGTNPAERKKKRRKSGEPARKRREQLRNWRKGYSDRLEANEGPSYEAGAF